MPNECQKCEFGNYTIGAQNLERVAFKFLGDVIFIECLHWDRPGDPFFIKASGPTPENCPKEKCVFCSELGCKNAECEDDY